jgi:hypothetical protein
MSKELMRSLATIAVMLVAAGRAGIAAAQIALTVANGGFETGSPTQTAPGWTVAAGSNPFWIGTSGMSANPSDGYLSDQFGSASWEIAGLPNSNSLIGGQANTALVRQDIDLTPYSAQISQGLHLGLSYAYFHNDGNDLGTISYEFFDAGNASLGTAYSATTMTGSAWQAVQATSSSAVPLGAASLRISLGAQRPGTGTARNIAFDAITASLVPPPPPQPLSGVVNGNLIHFDSDGNWTWYTDERAIVDPNNGHVLVNSVGFSPTVGVSNRGDVDIVDFNPATGRRVRTRLANQVGGNPNIQNDDHNVGGLLVLPDGRYLAMYANHGNNGGLGDEFSRWRRSINPGDSTSWTTEQLFNWFNAVPGANTTGNPEAANVSYHNLFYLSEENQVYDISRSYGRLSINGASQNMPNILRYDMNTNTVQWAGQLLESEAQGYSAYPKYASNGVDRIYFTTTETHPRNFNNSIYAGYIENGKTFDMLGNVVDGNIFDNGTTAGGSGLVPDVTDFTLVQQADPLGQGHNRLWTVDTNLDAGGQPMALYISRWNPDGSTSNGSTTMPIDHRLHFARWNEQTDQWEKNEVARMGNRLYRGTDLSEQDYTGNAALVPGDPSTIYISTPYDPRDPTGATFTTSYEIYKGKSADGGASWAWTAITENSVVDNLRPIVPDAHGGDTTVLWFRGTYTTAHVINAAVVGIVERSGETQGLVNYVDANTTNTMYASGSALQTSTPSGSAGPTDNLWHQRTGFGNGGSVLTSSESAVENAPQLKTTLSGLADGAYDVFAYFWSDNDEDWRLMAGLEASNLVDFRRYSSQHAEADQFVSIDSVAANSNDLQLYRAYLGRTNVVGGSTITAYIDDWQASGAAIRTWYDGLGYSLVSDQLPVPGDFDGNRLVDAADLTEWIDDIGANGDSDADGDGDTDGADFLVWQSQFGLDASANAAQTAVPEPGAWALLLTGAAGFKPRRRRR